MLVVHCYLPISSFSLMAVIIIIMLLICLLSKQLNSKELQDKSVRIHKLLLLLLYLVFLFLFLHTLLLHLQFLLPSGNLNLTRKHCKLYQPMAAIATLLLTLLVAHNSHLISFNLLYCLQLLITSEKPSKVLSLICSTITRRISKLAHRMPNLQHYSPAKRL